jgi:hypothetical protein
VKCREFIFLQTSGQLTAAPFIRRSAAAMHRWMCVKCRSFARNDGLLDGLLAEWRDHLTRGENTPSDTDVGEAGPNR